MKWWLAVMLCASRAYAQPAEPEAPPPPATPDAALVAQGEALARSGEFSRAIVAFKRADKLRPSAANACRIGLAYTRRELWSQAELFLARCKLRATDADPLPSWFDQAGAQLAAKLAEVDAAAIDVRVDAPNATISVSSFPPDEEFAPRAIHLTPGSYTIIARAPEREPSGVPIVVEGRTAQIVTIALRHPPPPPPPPPTRDQNLGRLLLYIGAGAAVIGVAAHGWSAYERSHLDDARAANDPVFWDRNAGSFETARAIAIGGYTVAVAGIVIGAILRTHGPEHGPAISATVDPHGATIGIEWHR